MASNHHSEYFLECVPYAPLLPYQIIKRTSSGSQFFSNFVQKNPLFLSYLQVYRLRQK